MSNKGGRPKSYSNEELLKILEKYVNNHKDEKIILSKLSKETGIARHLWEYSKECKEIIEKLNNPIIITNKISKEIDTLPSIESFLEQNSNSLSKMRSGVEILFKIINDLKGKVKECYELEQQKDTLNNNYLALKAENKKLKEQIKKQEIAMLELCIDSESLKKRNDKCLKNNIISINPKENIDKTTAITEQDIIKEFPWLAD